MKINKIYLVLCILLIPIVSATLSSVRFSPVTPTIAENLTILADFSGGFEQERLINWTKNGLPLGFLLPVSLGLWSFDSTMITQSYVYDGSISQSSLDGNLTGYDFNDGTITGATWTTGHLDNYALSFNGVSDYVDIDSPLLGSVNATICSWVYKESYIANQGWISDYENTDNQRNFFFTEYAENSIKFYIGNGTAVDVTTLGSQFVQDQWHYICGRFSAGDQLDIIFNGLAYESSTTIQFLGTQDNDKAWIGKYRNYEFDGKIDDVRVWDRYLQDYEIELEMNSSRPYSGDGLVLSMEMEEGAGATAYDTKHLLKGKNSTALNFDGIDDYVDLGQSFYITRNVTMGGWAKPYLSDSDYRTLFGFGEINSNTSGSLLYTKDDTLTFYLSNSTLNNSISYSMPSLNEWYHVLGVWDSENMSLYINGALENSTTTDFRVLT